MSASPSLQQRTDAATMAAGRPPWRLVYRSKQWGWLKVDLLLGVWALMNVRGLSTKELNQF
jgi:hypothetical protein